MFRSELDRGQLCTGHLSESLSLCIDNCYIGRYNTAVYIHCNYELYLHIHGTFRRLSK